MRAIWNVAGKPASCFSASQVKERAMPTDHGKVDAILKRAWNVAVHRNPMLMAKLRPDYDFTRLQDMIRDCLAKGLSAEETCEHTVKELFETARAYSQPSDDCERETEPVS
jgi:hypothetical protein